MARRKRKPETPLPKMWKKPDHPLDQAEATRMARKHPDVLIAERQVHEYLCSCGISEPRDPRWIFSHPEIVGDPKYQRLNGDHADLFSRIRRELME